MSSILVVEDEERIAAFVAKGLKAEGFTVTVVGDGITGLDYATTGEFDLVVLDIGLPGLNGFDVLERLSAARPDVKVIVLSARDSAADVVAGLEGGAVDYMSKPFSFAELLARVRLRLAQATAATENLEFEVGDVRLDLRRRTVYV
ncbi:MAG: response regulator transcription factor, partial [Actinomycetales bacterium]|nr:response regulator transcription factor [Actinomycetales bacterium]